LGFSLEEGAVAPEARVVVGFLVFCST